MASTAITAKHTITQPSPIAIWQAGEHLDEREVGDPVDARADGGRPASHGGGEDLALDQPARAADADSECGDEEREPTGPLAGCRAAREDNGTLVRRNVVMSVARLNAAPSSHRSSFTESSSDRGLDGAVCAASCDRRAGRGRREDGDRGPVPVTAGPAVSRVPRPGQQADDWAHKGIWLRHRPAAPESAGRGQYPCRPGFHDGSITDHITGGPAAVHPASAGTPDSEALISPAPT
jgi:hypothetical protein